MKFGIVTNRYVYKCGKISERLAIIGSDGTLKIGFEHFEKI